MNCEWCGCSLPFEWHPNCGQCGGSRKFPKPVIDFGDFTHPNSTELEPHYPGGAWIEPVGIWEIRDNKGDLEKVLPIYETMVARLQRLANELEESISGPGICSADAEVLRTSAGLARDVADGLCARGRYDH